jgi:hypothetical protein
MTQSLEGKGRVGGKRINVFVLVKEEDDERG